MSFLNARNILSALIVTVTLIFGTFSTAAAQSPGLSIGLELVSGGFSNPVHITNAGDGSGRLFVVEQGGRIRIFQNGSILSPPFLDIDPLVLSGGERGLLSVAFHPNYAANGYFYVNYTNNSGDTVIARYSVSATNPNIADPASAQILLTIDQPYSNHNGGQLAFGPDGYLYVGMGDGGSGGDPDKNGQDPTTLLGAILRLDVDNPVAGQNYGIPPDNPFVGQSGADEIWAIGVRNPWRFSFDRATGDLYIGDVGQNQYEEISFQAANTPGGVNFGWRCKEGFHDYDTSSPPCNDAAHRATLTDPIAEYGHNSAGGQSVTGGFVYRGTLFPNMVGSYFYADYVSRKIWRIYPDGNGFSAPEHLLTADFNISSFGEDEAGEIYLADLGGAIYHLVDTSGPQPDLSGSQKTANTANANIGETVTYTIRIENNGGTANTPLLLTDTVPANLAYQPGSFAATAGTVDDSLAPELHWQGDLNFSGGITLTYTVQVSASAQNYQAVNQAVLVSAATEPLTLSYALFISRPVLATTPRDFILPGTQPNTLAHIIANPETCDACHTEQIYETWRGSMMSQAARDPVFWAALAIANNDAPNSGEYCLRCHTPKGWVEGRAHPTDGSALTDADLNFGVSCNACHRLVSPTPSATDEAVAIDAAIRAALTTTLPISHTGNAMMLLDPEDRRRGPFSMSVPPPHAPTGITLRTDFLGQHTDAVLESSLCGTCHNVSNPVLSWRDDLQQYYPNNNDEPAPATGKTDLFPVETTFEEWLHSDYARGGVAAPEFAGDMPDSTVASCQDCHMRRSTGFAAEAVGGGAPVERDCVSTGCLPEHIFAGGNTWVPQILQDSRWRLNAATDTGALNQTIIEARQMLHQAATLTATITTSGTQKIAVVRVTNQTGHKLPTGYPEGRRMWLNVLAFDENGNLIFESGKYDGDTAVLETDANLKVYEVKQGLTPELAATLGESAGETFHFVLNNTVVKDNRIPPRGYSDAEWDVPGLRPVGITFADGQFWDDTVYPLPANATLLTVRLYYQTSSKAYIDFLRSRGGLDGVTLGELWDTSPSPPELMALTLVNGHNFYLPLIFK